MRIAELHHWPKDIADARVLQDRLRTLAMPARLAANPARVAGAVVEFDKGDDRLYAAVVVVDAHTFAVLEVATQVSVATFPYLPGYLSFREIPPLVEAFKKLQVVPDVVFTDRHGFAHPRRFGMACHLGLWLTLPVVGCCPTLLIGESQQVGREQGSMAPLLDENNGDLIGLSVRTRVGANPVFVSVGHRVTLPEAAALTLAQSMGRRMPVALRRAHHETLKLRSSVQRLDPEMAALVRRGLS